MSDVDTIHSEMLNNIDDSYQKTEGYPTYDLTRAFAIEALTLLTEAQTVEDKLDVDNLTGDELTRFVSQRKGIERKIATYATCDLTVTGTGTITEGDLFESTGGIQFEATETVTITSSGTVTVQAVAAGETGNVGANSITVIPVTIAGITAVTNSNAAVGGYAEETDTALRDRYYEALQEPATSGNIYHYKQWAKSVSGVGDAKVFPLWNGDNTVQVVIINNDKGVADSSLIAAVQEYIDPNISGTGEGEAPIGAYCTVASATGLNVNVSVTVSLISGYVLADVTTAIENSITTYLQSIAFQQDYVSYAKIGDAILNTDGVSDYSNLLINSGTANITIGDKEVAILGTVTVNE
jgi:uncharacterized phage protein gp47/JayE